MALAESFQQVVDSLPDDWTSLELDLRILDESRYIDAAVYLTLQRAELLPPPRGLALAADRGPSLRPRRGARGGPGTLGLLDDAGIAGELEVRGVRARDGRGGRCGAGRSRSAGSSGACGPVVGDARRGGAPDLLFGSKVSELLGAAGHEVVVPRAGEAPGRTPKSSWWTWPAACGSREVDAGRPEPRRLRPRRRGDARARQAAGFALVVPRSRFMREGAALVAASRRRTRRETSGPPNVLETSGGRRVIPKRASQAAHARRRGGSARRSGRRRPRTPG